MLSSRIHISAATAQIPDLSFHLILSRYTHFWTQSTADFNHCLPHQHVLSTNVTCKLLFFLPDNWEVWTLHLVSIIPPLETLPFNSESRLTTSIKILPCKLFLNPMFLILFPIKQSWAPIILPRTGIKNSHIPLVLFKQWHISLLSI